MFRGEGFLEKMKEEKFLSALVTLSTTLLMKLSDRY